LPTSGLALALLASGQPTVPLNLCASYIRAVQAEPWFRAAFAGHAHPLTVTGGRGLSHADAATRTVKIGTEDRRDLARCEVACLHELAHIVTGDHAPTARGASPQTVPTAAGAIITPGAPISS
jgi:hypothetical protein